MLQKDHLPAGCMTRSSGVGLESSEARAGKSAKLENIRTVTTNQSRHERSSAAGIMGLERPAGRDVETPQLRNTSSLNTRCPTRLAGVAPDRSTQVNPSGNACAGPALMGKAAVIQYKKTARPLSHHCFFFTSSLADR